MSTRLTILKCKHCGIFCDDRGNIFLPTKQLKAADKHVGFDDAQGVCNDCEERIGVVEIVKKFNTGVTQNEK